MRILKLSLIIAGLGLSWHGWAAEQSRTDINPALSYYQGYLLAPKLNESDRQYLFETEWRGKHLEERFGGLVEKYDNQFKFLRQAALQKAPCDWGIDMSRGPETLLPALAPAKLTAQTARLRAMWHLQNGRQAEARTEVLDAFVLGRNVSRDGVLISALVQVAIENIIASAIAENFFQWQPETLKELAAGLNASPARGTVAQTIPIERLSFYDWMVRKIQAIKQESSGNEAKGLDQVRDLLALTVAGSESGEDRDFPEKVLKAGGGTVDGVLKLVLQVRPRYDKLATVMSLGQGEFEKQAPQLAAEIKADPNPFVGQFLPSFEKCRVKEFSILAKLAMVQAGIEYKLHGEEGLKKVKDPFGNGPFAFRRFSFENQDRGFELKSAYSGRGFNEVLIFVEKDGPPFQIDFKNAGKPIPKSSKN